MSRLADRATLILTGIGVAFVAVIVVATGLGAIGRHFQLGGITWSFELVGMAFLWITAIGTVVAEITGENVSLDGMHHTPGRAKATLQAVILLLVASAMIWSGNAMLARTGLMPTPVMRAPSWVVQAVVPVMGAGLGLIGLIRLVRLARPSR